MTDDEPGSGTQPAAPEVGTGRRTPPAWFRPVLVVLVVAVCGWLASTFLGAIDWASVGEALGRLTVGEVLVLLVVLVVRHTVWRAVTILGPVLLGAVVTLVWRRRTGRAPTGVS